MHQTGILFGLFGATLVGVAVLPRRSLSIALGGCAALIVARLLMGGFDWTAHLREEWAKLTNLAGLIVGFALVADHFEKSSLPERLPRLLPRGVVGCFALLAGVWVLSGVLDNIAAALVGAATASRIFPRIHPGYAAGIVAAANAGGTGSVIGDTTTTMMWLEGISPRSVAPAYLGAVVAFAIFGIAAAVQQARSGPMLERPVDGSPIDRVRVGIVLATVAALILANLVGTALIGPSAHALPLVAAVAWVVLGIGSAFRPLDWQVARRAGRAALFLVALVLSASLLPVEALPPPSFVTTVLLGIVSAVFDNIPLTKLALVQGGYDWTFLAYSVGFGGSMLWFGSSAGVAVSELLPEVRSVPAWIRGAWHVPVAFLAGHAVMYLVLGWHP